MGEINIGYIAVMYVALLFSLSVHEAAHAAMSFYCGDPTAKLLGRATLNPIPHIDPIGTVVMPLIMFLSPGWLLFGWAKPVPFNPRNLRNMRRDPVFIALAGPASNVLLALLTVFLCRIYVMLAVNGVLPIPPDFAIMFCAQLIGLNLALAIFNMIPVPPLDGHHLLGYLLPDRFEAMLERIGPFGIIIVLVVVRPWLGVFSPFIFWVQEFAFSV